MVNTMNYFISKLKGSYISFHQYTYEMGKAEGAYWAKRLASNYELDSMAEYFSDEEMVDDFIANTGPEGLIMAQLLPFVIARELYGDDAAELF